MYNINFIASVNPSYVIEGSQKDGTVYHFDSWTRTRTLTRLTSSYVEIMMKSLIASLSHTNELKGWPIINVTVNGMACKALIDSGAQESVLSEDICHKANLPMHTECGDRYVHTIHGKVKSQRRLATIHFGDENGQTMQIAVDPIKTQDQFQLIIGCDVLQRMTFTYDGPQNRIQLSWVIP